MWVIVSVQNMTPKSPKLPLIFRSVFVGAAAFAALYHNKVPDTLNKKIVVVITGGNVTPHELIQHQT